jgi:hypothetical protein
MTAYFSRAPTREADIANEESLIGREKQGLSECGPPLVNLFNPHAIAIAVKAVAGVDSVSVRSQNEFSPGERAD